MSKPILYHYDLSPFSEKVRVMFGLAGMDWQSVKVPSSPPRPGLTILDGGYRRVPVMQIGADVYCDSKAIAAEVARRVNKPQLAVENCSADVQAFVQHAELQVFTAVLIASPVGVMKRIATQSSVGAMLRFVVDRVGIGRKAKLPKMSAGKATATLKAFGTDLESRLVGEFIHGDEAGAADFAAYTAVFFADIAGRKPLDDAPRTAQWYARMQAFGHGNASNLSDEDALDIAKAAEPVEVTEGNLENPRKVSIAPSDYARDPVVGELVAETASRWTLRREHPRIGAVHVHFPKAGFGIRDAQK